MQLSNRHRVQVKFESSNLKGGFNMSIVFFYGFATSTYSCMITYKQIL